MIYYLLEGKVEGYVIYWIVVGIFEIVEWNYLINIVFKVLVGFIGLYSGFV